MVVGVADEGPQAAVPDLCTVVRQFLGRRFPRQNLPFYNQDPLIRDELERPTGEAEAQM